ncbi:PEPxxWA-CTERM sorting domain-containing protein [Kordiimonas sp. SCSIO 12610]|uniref:PEPxxWA-CTERM sorting domain-containing protein n=1 Tax=Kordiimonas sp. SCSIO 12610 TaxID=2829597 RepID=UPI00210CDA88|nr:PEPxxWA-CTERM sorting domain-containing protein [Kordiimonas sp. SCSIO 12610]UTW55965.1 PEPxxWA-CTERM sorting domain-containing protein [Kordiimonas sp. SCSIO 12610]
MLKTIGKLGVVIGGLMAAIPAISSTATAATNFVVNGSFEQNQLAPGQRWGVFQNVSPGWYTIDGAGIEIQRSGTVVDAQDGTFYVELDSHNFDGASNDGSNTLMGQTLFGLGAGSYELSFYYQARTNNPDSDNGIRAAIGGQELLIDTIRSAPGGNSWQRYTLDFVLQTAGDVELTFGAFGRENTLGGFIDNVSVVAVPEPATWLMMILGFGMVGLQIRRRKATRHLFA